MLAGAWGDQRRPYWGGAELLTRIESVLSTELYQICMPASRRHLDSHWAELVENVAADCAYPGPIELVNLTRKAFGPASISAEFELEA